LKAEVDQPIRTDCQSRAPSAFSGHRVCGKKTSVAVVALYSRIKLTADVDLPVRGFHIVDGSRPRQLDSLRGASLGYAKTAEEHNQPSTRPQHEGRCDDLSLSPIHIRSRTIVTESGGTRPTIIPEALAGM